ncbi:MAG: hypothetical protein DA407_16775 [Bacteroidetes bacterium]|nr:MAG: hypothetical protein DA407_16775 [Bacteroidota bacterium]
MMIGILLALQVNNWNEDRKLNNEIQRAFANLHQEFISNYSELKNDILRVKKIISEHQIIMNFSGSKDNLENNSTLDSSLIEIRRWPTWNRSSFIFDEIKLSGVLSNYKDQNLKNMLYAYESEWENLLEFHQSTFISSGEVLNYFNAHGYNENLNKNLKKSNRHLLNDVYFLNILNQAQREYIMTLRRYDAMLIIMESIMETTKTYDINL